MFVFSKTLFILQPEVRLLIIYRMYINNNGTCVCVWGGGGRGGGVMGVCKSGVCGSV